jgi:Ca2+-binding RTX toxin-like protein
VGFAARGGETVLRVLSSLYHAMLDHCQPLENRRLFAANVPTVATAVRVGNELRIRGTNGPDSISVSALIAGALLSVNLNGVTTTVQVPGVRKLTVKTFDGNDNVSIDNIGIVSYVQGGAGNDTLSSRFSALLDGGDGDDTLLGSPLVDILKGGRGNDIIRSNGQFDIIRGGEGMNTIFYPNGDTRLGSVLVQRGDADGALNITGSKLDETFTFTRANSAATNISLSVSTIVDGRTFTASTDVFSITNIRTIRLDGGQGTDRAITPLVLFGTRPFSRVNIESESPTA